jgi:short-subunit dehydrogenase
MVPDLALDAERQGSSCSREDFVLKKNSSFAGKKIIITGSASGIGKALALEFANSGATVVLFDINGQALRKTADELANQFQCRVYSMEVDVSDYLAFEKAANLAINSVGLPDIFINNAGVGVSGEFVNNTKEEIDHITSVNYVGMVYGSRIIMEHFYQQGYGHLVNVASVAGLYGFPRMSLYCGTKFGIVGFTQAIRFEAQRHGIHVSLALPSVTDTPMIMDKIDEKDIPGILMATPLCKTQDVAAGIFRGIRKKQRMIFPLPTDRGSLVLRNYAPKLFDMFIRAVGFRSFSKKREKIMRAHGLG